MTHFTKTLWPVLSAIFDSTGGRDIVTGTATKIWSNCWRWQENPPRVTSCSTISPCLRMREGFSGSRALGNQPLHRRPLPIADCRLSIEKVAWRPSPPSSGTTACTRTSNASSNGWAHGGPPAHTWRIAARIRQGLGVRFRRFPIPRAGSAACGSALRACESRFPALQGSPSAATKTRFSVFFEPPKASTRRPGRISVTSGVSGHRGHREKTLRYRMRLQTGAEGRQGDRERAELTPVSWLPTYDQGARARSRGRRNRMRVS